MACHCVPEIINRGGGAVVNMATTQGIACQTRVAAYATAKGGAISLTRAMALDHAKQHIRANCVCPGSVDTPLVRFGARNHDPSRNEDEVLAEWGSLHPLGRVARPDEVASVYLFLYSEESSFITGTQIVVDGGLLAYRDG